MGSARGGRKEGSEVVVWGPDLIVADIKYKVLNLDLLKLRK